MIVYYKNKKLKLKLKKLSPIGMFRGLMFKKYEKNILLFEFKKECRGAIHSLFVFFPFLAVWLDEKNKVVDLKLIKPFALLQYSKKFCKKLIEIPINDKNKKIIMFFVGSKHLNI